MGTLPLASVLLLSILFYQGHFIQILEQVAFFHTLPPILFTFLGQ